MVVIGSVVGGSVTGGSVVEGSGFEQSSATVPMILFKTFKSTRALKLTSTRVNTSLLLPSITVWGDAVDTKLMNYKGIWKMFISHLHIELHLLLLPRMVLAKLRLASMFASKFTNFVIRLLSPTMI